MRYDPRQVIEIILDELAQVLRLAPEAVDHCRRRLVEQLRPRRLVLFLATGDRPPVEAAVESFRALVALGIEPTLIRSHSFKQVWSRQVLYAQLGVAVLMDELSSDEVGRLPDRFPLLCVLTLSSNTVAKTVLGLRDALPPRVVRAFLERGRPVIAAGAPPQRMAFDEDTGIFWGLPQALRERLCESYQTLERWGAEFVEAERLVEAVRRRLFGPPPPGQAAAAATPTASPSTERFFVTRDDVWAAAARGERQINLPPNSLVTHEAREFAARLGILLLE